MEHKELAKACRASGLVIVRGDIVTPGLEGLREER